MQHANWITSRLKHTIWSTGLAYICHFQTLVLPHYPNQILRKTLFPLQIEFRFKFFGKLKPKGNGLRKKELNSYDDMSWRKRESRQTLFPISFHYHNSQFTYDGYFPLEINFKTRTCHKNIHSKLSQVWDVNLTNGIKNSIYISINIPYSKN